MTEQVVTRAHETFHAAAEFDRQAENLIEIEQGYPELSGAGADGFRELVAPLRESAAEEAGWQPERGRVPFVPRALGMTSAGTRRTAG